MDNGAGEVVTEDRLLTGKRRGLEVGQAKVRKGSGRGRIGEQAGWQAAWSRVSVGQSRT